MPLLLQPIILALLSGAVIFVIPKKLWFFRQSILLVSTFFILFKSLWLFKLRPLDGFFKGEIFFSLDALSGFIFLAISLFGFIISLYSLGRDRENEYQSYYPYILWTIGMAQAVVLSNNIVGLIVFWGFLGLMLYLLVNQGGPEAIPAAKKALIMVAGADGFLILGLAILWKMTETFNMHEISVPISGRLSTISFLCILIAALTRAGAIPFHSWVPEVAGKGPVAVTALFPASLSKLLGIYLLGRICLSLYTLNQTMQTLLLIIGAFTIITAVSLALIQYDLKKFLGYQAVSQVGYMVLGFGTGNAFGIIGALFHLINSAIYNCGLFLSAGAVESRTKDSNLTNLGGLAKVMPFTFMAALIGSLAISGLPPLNGFVSKWMIYQSIIFLRDSGHKLWVVWLGVVMFGSALTLASFIKFLRAVFFGEMPENLKGRLKEVGLAQIIPLIILSLFSVAFGLFAFKVPLPFINEVVEKPLEYAKLWPAPQAIIFILIALAIGYIIYLRRPIYALAHKKVFDPYDQASRGIFYISGLLQKLHSGILLTYLAWALFGLVALLVIFLEHLF